MQGIVGKQAGAIAVAVAAGALVVSGCSQTQFGAAALYGNQRVSSAKLAAEVANLNAGFQKYEHKTQINYTQADQPRQVLSWLLRFATANEIAATRGIHVTNTDVAKALKTESSIVRRSGDTLTEAMVLNGLPPDMQYQLGRWVTIQEKLDNQLDHGKPPTSQAQSTALTAKVNHLQCVATKNLDIKVNPQYGVFDYAQYAVVAAPSNLATTSPSPGATPTPGPRLSPRC
ncbi:MAG TPA: hypothetical protein VFQ44_22630 [Streptosporangiaceae bacterium]|nr:hypothetical protein [Streptosporangiaceae bacterium]